MATARCLFTDCIWSLRHPIEQVAADMLHAHVDQRHPSAARIAELRAAAWSP